MKTYTLDLTIHDEIQAETIDEAWEIFSARVEDRYYGPTRDNIDEGYEIEPED